MIHFASLYVIWRFVYFLFKLDTFWSAPRGLIRNIYHLIFGADTILYFFIELIWLIPVAHIVLSLTAKFSNLKKLLIYLCMLVIAVGITSSIYFWPLGIKIESLRYFSPVGFLPYLPVALLAQLLFRNYSAFCNKIIAVFVPAAIILSAADWIFLPDNIYFSNGINAPITGYGRPSLVVSCFVLILIVLKIKQKPPFIIENLGNISLYVFCVHMIFHIMFGRLCDDLPLLWHSMFVIFSTLIASEILYYLISYIKSKRQKSLKP